MVVEWVLAVATVVLAAATTALVYATLNLVRATRSMDRRAALKERHALLLRKIELAARVVAVTHDEFRDRLKGGSVPGAFLDILELAGILEYPKDTVVDEHAMRRLVGVLREANRGVVYQELGAEEEWANLHHLQEQVNGNLSAWYDELGMIAAQLAVSLQSLTMWGRRPLS
jgi:hypothetical protein